MSDLANKTFYKFLIGFLTIVGFSFIVIMGTTYLAQVDAEQNTAQAGEEECVGENC